MSDEKPPAESLTYTFDSDDIESISIKIEAVPKNEEVPKPPASPSPPLFKLEAVVVRKPKPR